jgi:hypothetical protein
MDRLKSLHEGELGLIEVVDFGARAIPALRALLFAREPSGIYQPRRLAVAALAALQEYDVLRDFLLAPHDIPDPVQRLGEEAVMNAAALALAHVREEWVFDLLMSVAEDQILPGVVGALGAFERAEAIPHLVAALAEEESRPVAKAALRKLGARARPSLLVAAAEGSSADESESSLRYRRSALRLLTEIGIEPETWPVLRHLMLHRDVETAMLACEIGLSCAPELERREAVRRLIELLPHANWLLSDEIERRVAAYFEIAEDIIDDSLREMDTAPQETEATPNGDSTKNRIRRALTRVKLREKSRSQNK